MRCWLINEKLIFKILIKLKLINSVVKEWRRGLQLRREEVSGIGCNARNESAEIKWPGPTRTLYTRLQTLSTSPFFLIFEPIIFYYFI